MNDQGIDALACESFVERFGHGDAAVGAKRVGVGGGLEGPTVEADAVSRGTVS